MKKNLHNKVAGFTLIELLVVIAIIGILSSVVLVSLNTARNKGKDARIQGEVAQIRTALESEFNGSIYPSLTSTPGTSQKANVVATTSPSQISILNLAKDIESLNGKTDNVLIFSTSSATGYAIVASSSSGTSFCYDGYGTASTSYTGSAGTKVNCLY